MAAIEELYALLGWKLTGEDNLKRFQSNMKRVEQQLDAFVSRAGMPIGLRPDQTQCVD